MNSQIRNHPNYNPDDYAYLRAKGWADSDILQRWTEERRAGKGACVWSGLIPEIKLRAVIGDAA